MPKSNHRGQDAWYAVRVLAGRERAYEVLIRDAAKLQGERALKECFVPMTSVGEKVGDKWIAAQEPLLPGYLIAVTEEPDALAAALLRMAGSPRIVSQNGAFIPLSEQDKNWLAAYSEHEGQPEDISEGYVEDGVLHVTSGSLVGKEGMIRKVNHRKKVAYLEIEMFGRKVNAQVGIRIIRNKACKGKRKRE